MELNPVMSRGRRDRSEERADGLSRRCIATGQTSDRAALIRFVAGPDGSLVPDLAEKLPGRGAWVAAEREAVEKAVKKGLFSRALQAEAKVDAELPVTLAEMLRKRAIDAVSLARKAGKAVCGFERCREALYSGNVALLLSATDGAEGGISKLRGIDDGVEQVSALSSEEIGLAFGRDTVIHAALMSGGVTSRAIREVERLGSYRA